MPGRAGSPHCGQPGPRRPQPVRETTPGFTVWNLRGYWDVRENVLVWAGVENFTGKFYREHLDYRSSRGVFRPGINFYVGSEGVY